MLMAAGYLWQTGNIPKDTRGDITSSTDSDHEVGMEFIEDLLCRLLAQLVHLDNISFLVQARDQRSPDGCTRCAILVTRLGRAKTSEEAD